MTTYSPKSHNSERAESIYRADYTGRSSSGSSSRTSSVRSSSGSSYRGSSSGSRPSSSYNRRKKRRTNWGKIIIAILILAAVITGVILILTQCRKAAADKANAAKVRYVASEVETVPLWQLDEEAEEPVIRKIDKTIARGTCIQGLGKTYTQDEQSFVTITIGEEKYLIDTDCLRETDDELVLESEIWVRTSSTVYAEKDSAKIASFAYKGTHLDIVGYDELLEDGSVNMYEVRFDSPEDGSVTGWVYSKYLVRTEESALAVNEEINEIHKDRIYTELELNGGDPQNLDWYPVEKPAFEDNPILKEARGMYVYGGVFGRIDEYLEVAKANGVNCFVMDIKDGCLSCPMECAKELAPSAYEDYSNSVEEAQAVAKKIKDAGMYLICRIVVFNDGWYGVDHPDECIESDSATQLWPSAYSRNCWYYNVRLAEESIELFQPNEIQFDYVRFPEEAYGMSLDPTTDFKNRYDEDKNECIQNFLLYAGDVIHRHNVYLSADVFGECSGRYVTAYGQYWPAISNVVDAISSMPYTDHFGRGNDTWSDPYQTISDWAAAAHNRQTEIPSPAIARTWITGWDVPFWDPYITCDGDYIAEQVNALYDEELPGGFIIWHGNSSLTLYKQYADGWSRHYTDNPDY